MRLLLFLSVLLAAGAAQAEKVGKARSSVNGLYAIRFVESEPGRCRVEALKDSAVHWKLEQCLATIDDMLFVDGDGQRFWVIRTLPRIPKRLKRERRPPHLRAVVATLYEADGRVVRNVTLGMLLEKHRTSQLRPLKRHFQWLEGVFSVPGKAPRLNEKNQVELETVAAKTIRLEFR